MNKIKMTTLERYIRLERAAFNAWPAAQRIDANNVVICFADGYTKRANSANVLQIVAKDYEKLVVEVEAFYNDKQQSSIFRLPSFCDVDSDANFDLFLEQQGYYFHHQSLVLEKPLDSLLAIEYEKAQQHLTDLKINYEVKSVDDLDQWLACFNQLQKNEQVKKDNRLNPHLDILKRIKDKVIPAILTLNGKPVACALGVLNQEFFGLFDVVTATELRGKGLAQSLLILMIQNAIEQGATQSYLQVMSDNSAARKLYEKMEFHQSYSYWYRVKDLQK